METKYSVSRVNDPRWIKVRPKEANPDMERPPKLERNGEIFDTNSAHLVAPPGPYSPDVCHIYLCGTGCNPTQRNPASSWISTTSDAGIASIALSYQWGPYSDTERNQMFHGLATGDGTGDEGVQRSLENYHSDILFGGSKSRVVKVSFCNSVMGRLVSLLQYLKTTRPESEGWGRFISCSTADNTATGSTTSDSSSSSSSSSFPPRKHTGFTVPKYSLFYERLIFSGHSQGSGHVAFLAKHVQLARAVLVSGPQEILPQPSPLVGVTLGPRVAHRRGANELTENQRSVPRGAGRANTPASTSAATSALNSRVTGVEEEVEVVEAAALRRSWLDGPYATEDIRAFMHEEEELSASLIRQNWARIAPLAETRGAQHTNILFAQHNKLIQAGDSSGSSGVVVGLVSCLFNIVPIVNMFCLPYSDSSQDAPEQTHYVWSSFTDAYGNSYRMFYSPVSPENPFDRCGGRPNHLSTISDRNTPVDIYEEVISSDDLVFFPPSEDARDERQLVSRARIIAVPVYKKSIWKHLLLDEVMKPYDYEEAEEDGGAEEEERENREEKLAEEEEEGERENREEKIIITDSAKEDVNGSAVVGDDGYLLRDALSTHAVVDNDTLEGAEGEGVYVEGTEVDHTATTRLQEVVGSDNAATAAAPATETVAPVAAPTATTSSSSSSWFSFY